MPKHTWRHICGDRGGDNLSTFFQFWFIWSIWYICSKYYLPRDPTKMSSVLDILSTRIFHPLEIFALSILAPRLSVLSWRLHILSNAIRNFTLKTFNFEILEGTTDIFGIKTEQAKSYFLPRKWLSPENNPRKFFLSVSKLTINIFPFGNKNPDNVCCSYI